MLLRIVSIVFPIFAIVALGYLYGRRKRPVMDVVNQVNMDVFIPALIFHVMANRSFDPLAYTPIAMGGITVILGSGLIAYAIARWRGYSWRMFVPSMMFTNYGNLGLPLFLFAFGPDSLPAAVVLFIVGSLLHFTLGRWLLDHKLRLRAVLAAPIVLSAIAGLAFSLMQWRLPHPVSVAVEMVGQVSIPLLLFSLGVRLISIDWRDWRIGVIGATVCPLTGIVMALLVLPFLGLPDLQARQLLLFGALPPAVLNFLFAEEFDQGPREVAAMVMIGTIGALVVIPVMLLFLLR